MKLSVFLKTNEIYAGIIYLLIDLFALPAAMGILNAALPVPLDAAVLNFIFFCINFLAVTVLLRRFLRANFRIFREDIGKCLLYALAGFVLYRMANLAIGSLILLFYPDFANVNDASIATMMGEHFVIMAVGTVLLVPITEELLYRGVVFRGLYERFPRLAWVVSTAVFAFIHVMGFIGSADLMTICLCFIQYIPAALVLAWSYGKTDSIMTPVLVHTAVNLVGILSLR